MKRIIRLTEQDLNRIIKRVLKEQQIINKELCMTPDNPKKIDEVLFIKGHKLPVNFLKSSPTCQSFETIPYEAIDSSFSSILVNGKLLSNPACKTNQIKTIQSLADGNYSGTLYRDKLVDCYYFINPVKISDKNSKQITINTPNKNRDKYYLC